MSYFDTFSEEQKALLAALPYRVGLWISKSDEDGGIEADEQERQALHGIITGFTQDFLKSEFVEALMLQTMARSEHWDKWDENLDSVPSECGQALDMIIDKLEQKDVLSFKITLMEIARNVAMAFRETDYESTLLGRMRLSMKIGWDRLLTLFTHQQPKTMIELLNISQAEHKALDILGDALRIEKTEGQPNKYADDETMRT